MDLRGQWPGVARHLLLSESKSHSVVTAGLVSCMHEKYAIYIILLLHYYDNVW